MIAAALLVAAAATGCPEPAASRAEQLASAHPAQVFRIAVACERAGESDLATFWFYLGQLRYRIYLRAHPAIDSSGDPALFASLMATVGPSINGYAYGDIPALRRVIAHVLAWDDGHADRFTPKTQFPAERATTRRGLRDLSATVAARAGAIRRERAKNGLSNR